jgi:hypothetical protein
MSPADLVVVGLLAGIFFTVLALLARWLLGEEP